MGNKNSGGWNRENLRDRFWRLVNKTDSNLCWNWLGCFNYKGYGKIGGSKNSKSWTTSAHRLSYTLNIGQIPKGMWVLHTCDNRACVNPSHLWLGTSADNVKDMAAKGRNFVPDWTKRKRNNRGQFI